MTNGARWLLTQPSGTWIRICPDVLARPCFVPWPLVGASGLSNLAQRRAS